MALPAPRRLGGKDLLSAELIAERSFPIVRRGFERADVQEFLRQVAEAVGTLHTRLEDAEEARQAAEERAKHPDINEDVLMARVGEETAAILRSARSAASDIQQRANDEAARIVDEAHQSAASIKAEAEAAKAQSLEEANRAADDIRGAAQAAADQLLERTRHEVDSLRQVAEQERKLTVESAQSVREKILADLTRRRRVATVQIEQLRAGRERLLQSYGVVRSTLQEVNDELQRADAEARAAADEAGRVWENAELPDLPPDLLAALQPVPEAPGAPHGPASGADRPPAQVAVGEPHLGAGKASAGAGETAATAPEGNPSAGGPGRSKTPAKDARKDRSRPTSPPAPGSGSAAGRSETGTTKPAEVAKDPATSEVGAATEEAEAAAGDDGDDKPGPASPASGKDSPASGKDSPASGKDEDGPATGPTGGPGEEGGSAGGKAGTSSAGGKTSASGTGQASPAGGSGSPAGGPSGGKAAGGRQSPKDSRPGQGTAEPTKASKAEPTKASKAEPPAPAGGKGAGKAGKTGLGKATASKATTVTSGASAKARPGANTGTAILEAPATDDPPVAEESPAAQDENDRAGGIFDRIRAGREEAVQAARQTLEADVAPTAGEAGTAEEAAGSAEETDEAAAPEPAPGEAKPDLPDQVSDAAAATVAERAEAEDEAPEVARSEGDEELLERRDQVLGELEIILTRKLKRALQDEQNALLDRLRNARGLPDGDSLLGAEDDQQRRYYDAALPQLELAAREGARFAANVINERGGETAPKRAPKVDDLARELSEELGGHIRRRVEAALDSGRGDEPSAVTEALGAAYREIKTQRVESTAGDMAVGAFSRGIWETVGDRIPLRWVVEDVDGPCADCDDNALAGGLPRHEGFPTGQAHPPAHAGCRCLLVPEPS